MSVTDPEDDIVGLAAYERGRPLRRPKKSLALLICRWSVGPCWDKGVVSNILAAASIAPDVTDCTDLARSLHGSMEVTSSVRIAVQTGSASVCGVCVKPCEQRKEKQCRDPKP